MPGGSLIPRDRRSASAVLTICFLAFAWILCARSEAKEDPQLAKLAENIYARIVSPDSNAVSNAGFIILENSVLVFDTHFTPEAGQALLTEIKSLTPKSVRFVVNSHAHADHTHGNQAFPGALLLGSANARRDILQVDLPSLNRTTGITEAQLKKLRRDLKGLTDPAKLRELREQIRSREEYLQTMARLKISAPVLTFEDNMTIQNGKQELRLLFLGKGHTDGDIVLMIPDKKIAFLGDLFFNNAIPNVQDASILSWMKTLDEVLKLDADTFVPGHGEVGNRKDVEKFRSYFEELQSLVKPAVERGDTIETVMKEVVLPAKYSGCRFTNFFPSNVQKMYTELKALYPAPDAPPNAPAKPEPSVP